MKIFKKQDFGQIAILGLLFLPVLFWLNATPLIPRFSDFAVSMVNIGQVAGLVGMAAFAISLILSARPHFLEKYFNGLNMLYKRHNELGQISFILLLFHPLFLLPKYAGNSLYQAYIFLIPTANWAKNWGWFSLAIMIMLIILTLYLKPRYNIWKQSHKFMGLAFLFSTLHLWLTPSDTSRDMILRSYMLLISGAGLAAFIYKTILGNLLIKRYSYIVAGVRRLDRTLVEIIMKPEGERMKFIAGQFIFIGFSDKNIGTETHPFSVSSGEDDEFLAVTVKNLGDYTANLSNLRIGSRALIECPFGLFSYKNTTRKNQVWIAGGIGITPFLSMAKSLKAEENYNIDLYYCTKNKEDAVFMDMLQNKSAFLNNTLKIIGFYSEERGYYINAEVIRDNSGPLENKDIFICAPPAMIQTLREQFKSINIDKKLIHSEEFNF